MGVMPRVTSERRCEIAGVAMLALTVFLFVALAMDRYQGQSARSLTDLGAGGTVVAGALYLLFGHAAHLLYIVTGAWGVMLLRHQPLDRIWSRTLGFFLLTASVAGFIGNLATDGSEPGGMVGGFVMYLVRDLFGAGGTVVITITFALIGMLLATEFLFVRMLQGAWSTLHLMIRSIENLRDEFLTGRDEKIATKAKRTKVINVKAEPESDDEDDNGVSMFQSLSSLFSKRGRTARPAAPKKRRSRAADGDGAEEDVKPARRAAAVALPDASASADDEADAEQLEFEGPGKGPAIYISTRTEADAARAPEKRALRRKAFEEELPADYKYPKKYEKPPLSMFDEPIREPGPDVSAQLRETALQLEETLKTFGIEADVTDIVRGPTITRYELEPASGVKVSRFTALADDIALALKAHGVRVEAPIPGKGRVGIELPNEHFEAVTIREILESDIFRADKSRLALAMGKDIAGDVLVADLASMPHLLVAGATGSGKTVFVKTILASLLATKTPDELQMILIDPKMVELSIFNNIPHLTTPVVIDPKKAATALSWLIHEMEQRYELFTQLRVRNIEVYNESVENGEIEVESSGGEGSEGENNVAAIRKLPYIVCVIDELADLMMLARAEVEDAIFRLAQLARAVGIHLIIATQRPSVDVLTGVIKANLPARVSFQVSSRVDSRCILEVTGAERLLGRGDMLYLPPGRGKPMRLQSAFVSDQEMNDLIAYLKTQAPPQYRDEIVNYGKAKETVVNLEDDNDELFEDAVRVVTETGQASISMIQRRLRVGYTRAARLIDMMELRGIVGPHLGSKAREILIPTAANHEDEVA
jgi:S-DNA-T family DNA segregation ATPase FtsK/SpoIIIE